MAASASAPPRPAGSSGAGLGWAWAASEGRQGLRLRDLRVCLGRLVWLARVALLHAAAHFLLPRLRGRPLVGSLVPAAPVPGPERLRLLFEDLGGTFVKFGQMLALQPDILSVEYCDALFKLLDRIEPFPFREAARIFHEELGRAPREIFDTIEEEPLATASVGQVHVAYLEGRKVAVKVQRPNVEVEFINDVRLMRAGMWLVRTLRIRPLYWLLEPTGEFVAWSQDELDYRNEAAYSERLRALARENPAQHVPAVIAHLSTRRTLVVEFLEGTTILDYLRARERGGDEILLGRLERKGFDSQRFATHLIGNFLGDAFRHGIYHADLHPANLMILEDNVVGYLDFGITGVMSPYSQEHLLAMTLALARGDVETMKAEYLWITAHDESSDLEAFRRGLDRLAAGWYDPSGKRLTAKITLIFNQILALSRATGFLPERDIVKFIRSAIAIDGLLSRFEPGFDIGRHMAADCARCLGERSRRRWLSAERLEELSRAGTALLTRGPELSAELLGRFGMRREPPRVRRAGAASGDSGSAAARSLALAAVLFGLLALSLGLGEPAPLGVNLWTAELLFFAAAGWKLLGLWRGASAAG